MLKRSDLFKAYKMIDTRKADRKKVLFNASNLHIGGGLQVGTSLIYEISKLISKESGVHIFCSTKIRKNIESIKIDNMNLSNIETVDVYGFSALHSAAHYKMNAYETVLTIFGPLYRWKVPFRSIVGFAQAWIIYPNNECYAMLRLWERLKMRAKFWVQAQFFKRADALIVELEHVRQGLIRELGIPEDRIYVIHNCLSSVYHDKTLWQDVNVPDIECDLRLGFLGRNYLHKNTAIFPRISAVLKSKYGIRAKFFVTFTEDEWRACSPEFRAACVNLGPLTVAQCPNFYRAMDAVVFPSLLECFSATPLETMAMERPLIASDRPFNRDVCGPHAHYFDPLDPESAAAQIATVFGGDGPDRQALRAARDHAISFSSPRERAEKYLALVTCVR